MMGACHRDVQRKMMGWWGALCAKSKENWPGQILVWWWPGTGLVQAGAGLVLAWSRLVLGWSRQVPGWLAVVGQRWYLEVLPAGE